MKEKVYLFKPRKSRQCHKKRAPDTERVDCLPEAWATGADARVPLSSSCTIPGVAGQLLTYIQASAADVKGRETFSIGKSHRQAGGSMPFICPIISVAFIYICGGGWGDVHMLQHACDCQKSACESHFFLSETMWVLKVKLTQDAFAHSPIHAFVF